MAALGAIVKKVWSIRRFVVLLFGPLVLLPILFSLPPKGSFRPTKSAPQYFLDTNFLFLSGLIMAAAIEEWNLHRRIALRILMLVGVQPARLILGMMLTTSFLSMWLSNTASTAMMLPIATAVLKSLFGDKEKSRDIHRETEESQASLQPNKLHIVPTEMQLLANTDEKDLAEEKEVTIEVTADVRKEEEFKANVWKGFLISIPYAASIGGTATLTGTAPNLLLLGQLKRSWRKKKSDIRTDAEARARAVIRDDYQKLGPIKFAEQAVFVLFCLFAFLLFSRDPKFIPGWASLFTPGFVTDAVTGVTIVTILFFFPSKRPSLKWWFDLKAPNTETVPLLTWRKAQETVPWNIIILLGGGFAMAKGCEESGLSAWIGGRLDPLENVPPPIAVILITIVIASFTEFASNTATIIIFLPVLAELAIHLRVNPLYLMIPGTIGCSFAFMLPVSTPPNSIAFASGHLLVKDMVRTGLLMNLMGVLLLSLAINTWAKSIFQLGTFPDWANVHSENITSLLVDVQNLTLNSMSKL
ncbi:hypothetical protein lerEdw1_002028 [Lerista edwardsae]|nr:hypothetical protein lerEdw1_002028 [Lerista edwardsae]